MGGLMILAGITVATLLWANLSSAYVWVVLGVTLLYGGIGFYDDFVKVTRRTSDGFSGKVRFGLELAVAGLATYCLFPAAPPWMAARDGLSEPVARLSSRGWVWLHMDSLDDVLADAQHDGANPVAAMPSLHIAFAVLVALVLGGMLRSRWRYLLALYPVAMGLALVYTGEHYVVDLLAGAFYAVVVHLALNRWDRWRAVRLYERAAATPDDLRQAEPVITS